jgi:hypothetical protein
MWCKKMKKKMKKKIIYSYLSGIGKYRLFGSYIKGSSGRKVTVAYIECQTNIKPNKIIKFGKIILNKDGVLRIECKFLWDGPSGPTFDTESFMRGSCFHDALYKLMEKGLLDSKYRKKADKLLRKHCREDGMGRFRAWYVYRAVRMFGGSHAK